MMGDNNSSTAWVKLGKTGGTSSKLTSTNLFGIASGAISDTATGKINTWGSRNEGQTGLTIDSDYYVQTDGTITTVSDGGQLIGKAITATQINRKDYTGGRILAIVFLRAQVGKSALRPTEKVLVGVKVLSETVMTQ